MIRKLTFAIIAFAIILLLLEFTARLAEKAISKETTGEKIQPGWQAEFFKTFLDWHEPDPELLWRFKAGLNNPLIKTNSEHLLGGEIPKDKPSTSFRILLLGDSSPVGLGLKARQQAFGEMLKIMLQANYAGQKNIELVNAAVSGYTSEQIARFLKDKGWKYDPDLVLVYCGNNDASISGPYSDRELLEGQKLKSVRSILANLALYRMMTAVMVGKPIEAKDNVSALKVRVDAPTYGENLSEIADDCRTHQCPLIILKPPVPKLWPAGLQFKLFAHISGDDGQLIFPPEMVKLLGRPLKYCLDIDRFRQIYGQADIFTRNVYQSAYNDSLPPQAAIMHYAELLKSAADDPVVLNNLGVSYWQNSQYDSAGYYLSQAREYYNLHHNETVPAVLSAGSSFLFNIGINLLSSVSSDSLASSNSTSRIDTAAEIYHTGYKYLDSALQADYFSLRIKRAYWDQIDRLADKQGVLVIDLPSVFASNGGEKLFIDHCHPTPDGHRLIAEKISTAIITKGLIK